jgi:UDP-glucose 4-epimerase
MKILVCGGAGYIGSHLVRALLNSSTSKPVASTNTDNHQVVVLDDFSSGHAWAVPETVPVLRVNLMDSTALESALTGQGFDAVVHFAARSLVAESVVNPALYYRGNVLGTFNLLEVMRKIGIRLLVFSSSAAIFGHPVADLIEESHPKVPINPYGKTKLVIEDMLADYAHAYGINSVCLRYFNAAGADISGVIGEAHEPETHLIPNILLSLIRHHDASLDHCKRSFEKTRLKVFGNDYTTPDGTCVRDYVHVSDLASAHLLALKFLFENSGFHAFNLGNGNGFSVLEVIQVCQEVSAQEIPFEIVSRRPGDPARLVANSYLARHYLGWKPIFESIDEIVLSAWQWHSGRHKNIINNNS